MADRVFGSISNFFFFTILWILYLQIDNYKKNNYKNIIIIFKPPTGFEPVTFRLQSGCSTN